MTEIRNGQAWRRKSDGTLISLINTGKGDCYWESVEGKKRGNVLTKNLPMLYELVEDEG